LLLGPGGLPRADLGQIPEACARTDVGLRLRGEVLIATADFYGALVAASTLRARLRFWDRWAATAALDTFTFRYVVNAVVDSSGSGVGPATLGLARSFERGRFALAPYGRLLLPIDTARRLGALWGLELGLASHVQLRPRLAVQGGLTLPATIAVVEESGHIAWHPNAAAEAVYSPRPWIAFAGGAALRTALFPDAELLALAARASARLLTAGGWSFALGGDVPIAGSDRIDATLSLFVGWSALGLPAR
jgi:hypothetical protein